MKLVTFSEPQAPHGVGDTRLVPDDVAARLGRAGVLSAAETWPAGSTPAASKPARPAVKPIRPAGTPDKRLAR